MKRCFIIIHIDKYSYDYERLLKYITESLSVSKVSRTSEGFLIDLVYEEDYERREFVSAVIILDINNIEIHDMLYEEFYKGA